MYEKKMIRTKELGKNTLIITIGRISTQFITFLLLPLYTALLSTEEYGSVDLVTTIVQLLVPIVSIMINMSKRITKKEYHIKCFFYFIFFEFVFFIALYFFNTS